MPILVKGEDLSVRAFLHKRRLAIDRNRRASLARPQIEQMIRVLESSNEEIITIQDHTFPKKMVLAELKRMLKELPKVSPMNTIATKTASLYEQQIERKDILDTTMLEVANKMKQAQQPKVVRQPRPKTKPKVKTSPIGIEINLSHSGVKEVDF